MTSAAWIAWIATAGRSSPGYGAERRRRRCNGRRPNRPKVPFAKAKVVAALTQPYTSKPEALQASATSLHAAYPDPAQADPLIAEAQTIYRQNFFPRRRPAGAPIPGSGYKTGMVVSVVMMALYTADGKRQSQRAIVTRATSSSRRAAANSSRN